MRNIRHVVYEPPEEGLPYLSVLLEDDNAKAAPCATLEAAKTHKFSMLAEAAKGEKPE